MHNTYMHSFWERERERERESNVSRSSSRPEECGTLKQLQVVEMFFAWLFSAYYWPSHYSMEPLTFLGLKNCALANIWDLSWAQIQSQGTLMIGCNLRPNLHPNRSQKPQKTFLAQLLQKVLKTQDKKTGTLSSAPQADSPKPKSIVPSRNSLGFRV